MTGGRIGRTTVIIGLALAGCGTPNKYNTLDLALLPCEQGQAPIFFKAVEFGEDGRPLFEQQTRDLADRITQRGRWANKPVQDLVVFVHGWNKNPTSAETDYQDFLCRLHGRLRANIDVNDRKGNDGLLVVGLFWPSTITGLPREPVALEPLSYYRIRDRVDVTASGVAELLATIGEQFRTMNYPSDLTIHFSLVGHSFGARMLAKSIQIMAKDDKLVPFLSSADAVNVVLINGALGPERLDFIRTEVTLAKKRGTPARFTDDTNSFLYNVHSFNDAANSVLYPIASAFSDDKVACAVGACGVDAYPTVCTDATGALVLKDPRAGGAAGRNINAWNVDATAFVYGHSDIYKGRMALLVASLLYDAEARKRYPSSSNLPTERRCTVESQ